MAMDDNDDGVFVDATLDNHGLDSDIFDFTSTTDDNTDIFPVVAPIPAIMDAHYAVNDDGTTDTAAISFVDASNNLVLSVDFIHHSVWSVLNGERTDWIL